MLTSEATAAALLTAEHTIPTERLSAADAAMARLPDGTESA